MLRMWENLPSGSPVTIPAVPLVLEQTPDILCAFGMACPFFLQKPRAYAPRPLEPHPAFTRRASKTQGSNDLHGVQQAFQPWVFLSHCEPFITSPVLGQTDPFGPQGEL